MNSVLLAIGAINAVEGDMVAAYLSGFVGVACIFIGMREIK